MTSFPDLRHDRETGIYSLQITDAISTGVKGRRHLFGGAGLAAAILAMEKETARPCRRATIQFDSAAPTGSAVGIQVSELSRGRTASQACAVGRLGSRTVFTALATHQEVLPSVHTIDFPLVEKVPPPDQCQTVVAHADADEDIHAALDIRLIRGRFGIFSKAGLSEDGHVLVWMKSKYRPFDAAGLAIATDFVPSTASNALNMRAGGRSFDNTLRIIQTVEEEWILCDIHISTIHGGVGHGAVNVFAPDGRRLAIASQSFSVLTLPRGGAGEGSGTD